MSVYQALKECIGGVELVGAVEELGYFLWRKITGANQIFGVALKLVGGASDLSELGSFRIQRRNLECVSLCLDGLSAVYFVFDRLKSG